MMNNLKCIIVDDEQGAHLVLTHYLAEVKTLELSGSFYNAIEALEYLYRNEVDLVFLDINMPGLSGMEMLETMSRRPFIILTTAYKEYALEGYRYEVVDYLVKPFDLRKFLSAIDKVFNRLGRSVDQPARDTPPDHLMLAVNGDLIKVAFCDILYVQSFGNYVKIFTTVAMYLSQMTTNEIEEKLDTGLFIRIHRSYIVCMKRIARVSQGQLYLADGTQLPIGNTFKRKIQEYFK